MRNQVKTDVIKLLEQMRENAHAVQISFEKSGDNKTAEFYKGEKLTYTCVISLLSDESFFDKMWSIYNKEEY